MCVGDRRQAERIAAKGGDRLPQATKKGGIAAERSRGAAKGFKFVGWKLSFLVRCFEVCETSELP